jgi:hypothetical protein
MELNLNFYDEAVKKYKKLLADKEKLVGQKNEDGRNQFQVEINKLKKSIKGQNFKFNDVKNDTLKQERQGKFDRGAEGKAKKAMRKKMLDKRDASKRGGVHAGTRADEENKLIQRAMDDPELKAIREKNKKKKKTGPGAR